MTREELEAALEATDELEGETLRDLSLSGAEWRKKRFEGCRFERCTLDRATLRGGVFTECELEGCDLTMLAAYDVAFRDVGDANFGTRERAFSGAQGGAER